ncbi:MAG TPA: hypothetical protein VIA18_20385 [Polyangia bacterium]|jgi:hypothetical protein|nr:hypothetical protein [Polyangia bacterium]
MLRTLLAAACVLAAGCSSAKTSRADASAAPADLSASSSAADFAARDSGSPIIIGDGGDGGDGGQTSCALTASGAWLDFVDAVVVAMRAGGNAGSEALTPPAVADRDAFAARVVAILGGDEAQACALPASYRLVHLAGLRVIAEVDAGGAPSPALFWGTYAAPITTPTPSRRLAIEAPHPIFDANTEHQAADLFVQSGARWFLLAGAHRCADAVASGCDGTTTACSTAAEDYRVSDAAHATQLPFWAVHAQLSQLDAQLLFIQLHGNSDACPAALVSDGSGSWSDSDAAGELAAALVARSVAVGKCGAGYPTATCTLCGTDNVEGRFTAGAADACTMLGTTYGRFVHIEQQPGLRTSYQPLIDAVNATF